MSQCSRLSLTLWNLLRAWMFWLPDGGCQRLSKNETVIFCISKWRCIVWMMDGPCWLTGPLYVRVPCVNSGTLSAASHVGLFRGSCQSSFLLPLSINQKSHWEEACHSHVTLKGTGERCGWHTQVGARKVNDKHWIQTSLSYMRTTAQCVWTLMGEKDYSAHSWRTLNTTSYREVKRFIKISALQTKANISPWFDKNTLNYFKAYYILFNIYIF